MSSITPAERASHAFPGEQFGCNQTFQRLFIEAWPLSRESPTHVNRLDHDARQKTMSSQLLRPTVENQGHQSLAHDLLEKERSTLRHNLCVVGQSVGHENEMGCGVDTSGCCILSIESSQDCQLVGMGAALSTSIPVKRQMSGRCLEQ